MQAFVDDAQAGMARYDYRRGCLIGNLGQEMGALPESFRAQLQAVFADWRARLAACAWRSRRAKCRPPQTPSNWRRFLDRLGRRGVARQAGAKRRAADGVCPVFLAGLPR